MTHIPVEVFFQDYSRSISEAGGVPVLISKETDIGEVMSHLDGVMLPGGADIDPALYGAVPEADLMTPESDRDAQEIELLDAAATLGVPVLGICRGLQMINVWRGGTLNQDVPAHACWDESPHLLKHEVFFESGSLLQEVYEHPVSVNSLHHQTVDRIGHGLTATARSPEGVVEGLECEDAPVVAVQWHPELLPDGDPIFDWFVHWIRPRRC